MTKTKKYVIEQELINFSLKNNLSLEEFILLTYFDNAENMIFDVSLIARNLNIDEVKVIEAASLLLEKKLIKLDNEISPSGKRNKVVSLKEFYNNIDEIGMENKKKKEREEIFTKIEKAFKRPLSSNEIEVIKVWLDKCYTEDLISKAVDEAIYNSVTNIRYIDTILCEWYNKGIKSGKDVDEYFENKAAEKKLEETSVYDYNWLDDVL